MRRTSVLVLAGLACACGDGRSPVTATLPSAVAFTRIAPASGTTITVPAEFPYFEIGGVVLPQGSALLSAGLALRSARAVPWAQLRVYLLTSGDGSEYCGQNLPDAPTWTDLPAGWQTTYTVTGFQVYRLPCDVTAIRAMLHTRNTGLLTPPASSDIVAEATMPVRLAIRR
ncbi:MAG TPA: hypothetical protein VIG50_11940 [Vicinamibacteria bacterium]|jgi:hypothetical protein